MSKNKKETRGGKRPLSGRKKADYETKTIAFRVRVEFDGTEESGKYFILTQDRATAFGTSNGIRLEETDQQSWLMEAHFIKRFNELV